MGWSRQPISCRRVVFPGAGRADQGGKFAALDGQVDAAQGLGFHRANFVDTGGIINFYDFHFILLFIRRAYFSARRASTGCKREAMMAGYRPARMVTMKVTMDRLIVLFNVNLAKIVSATMKPVRPMFPI